MHHKLYAIKKNKKKTPTKIIDFSGLYNRICFWFKYNSKFKIIRFYLGGCKAMHTTQWGPYNEKFEKKHCTKLTKHYD